MQTQANLLTSDQLLKSSIANYINLYEWDYFVTLTFKQPVSYEKSQSVIRKFIKLLNNELFGDRSHKAIHILPVIEPHLSKGFHVHLLLTDPLERMSTHQKQEIDSLKDAVQRCWKCSDSTTAWTHESCPDGASWFKPITETPEVLGYYLSKTIPYGNQEAIQWDMAIVDGQRLERL